MKSIRFARTVAEFLDAIDDEAARRFSPDGLEFFDVLELQREAYAELAREGTADPTSWLSMNDEQRAAVRPRRRGHLHVVANTEFSASANDSEEAA